jgi:MoxR-like ATPase
VTDEKPPPPDWKLFLGKGDGKKRPVTQWPAAPPWRDFLQKKNAESPTASNRQNPDRGRNYIATPEQAEMVNAALYLRRPLLITGRPGTGKSSLAYAIAFELDLGPVLRWPITSRSTLLEGLYRYDAIGRLQEANLGKSRGQATDARRPDIGDYLSLGPLGTAFYDSARHPRVLLVDEIDKSDIDLPNDLLNIFEEGEFEIPELVRYKQTEVHVRLFDSEAKDDKRPITKGRIRCAHFPIVVMTSNGEREFPSALLRRCLRLDIAPPNKTDLTRIVEAHLGQELSAEAGKLIKRFWDRRQKVGHLANDQLLNAVFLLTRDLDIGAETKADLEEKILRILDEVDGR